MGFKRLGRLKASSMCMAFLAGFIAVPISDFRWEPPKGARVANLRFVVDANSGIRFEEQTFSLQIVWTCLPRAVPWASVRSALWALEQVGTLSPFWTALQGLPTFGYGSTPVGQPCKAVAPFTGSLVSKRIIFYLKFNFSPLKCD